MLADTLHVPLDVLEAGLDVVRRSPRSEGALAEIVRRPAVDVREVVDEGRLDVVEGLVGDNWLDRGNSRMPGGVADPERQLTLMNVRAADLVAGTPERRALAGDQLYVDFDLSEANLPAGARLVMGEAVVEISAVPHTGCAKFKARFGRDALRFVSTPEGRALVGSSADQQPSRETISRAKRPPRERARRRRTRNWPPLPRPSR